MRKAFRQANAARKSANPILAIDAQLDNLEMEARVVLLEVGNFGFEQVLNFSTMGGVTEEDNQQFDWLHVQ